LDELLRTRPTQAGVGGSHRVGSGPGGEGGAAPACVSIRIPVSLHKSMTTSRMGCEQQTRTLPSAGLSGGSRPETTAPQTRPPPHPWQTPPPPHPPTPTPPPPPPPHPPPQAPP